MMTNDERSLLDLHGIGGIYAELLEAAGVTAVPQLAAWDPVVLHARLYALARDHEPPVFRRPSLAAVTSWVAQAADVGSADAGGRTRRNRST